MYDTYLFISMSVYLYNNIIESNKVRMHHKYNYLILHN